MGDDCVSATRVINASAETAFAFLADPASHAADDGTLGFGGWTWRYELAPAGSSRTIVTLGHDWSAVPDDIREGIGFPAFPPEHLDNSLAHLAESVIHE
jgi:hypothetical protein